MLGGGLLKGLVVTARNFVRSYYDPERLTTIQYPEEKLPTQENYRSFPFLIYDDTPENLRCVACKICENECPPQCIYIEIDSDPKTGKLLRRPRVFDIDYSVCMQCQICVEVCPFDAIKMDKDYELSRGNRFDGLLFDRSALLKSNEYFRKIRPTEAAVVDARLSKTKKKPAPAPKPAAKPPAAKPAPPKPARQIKVPEDAPFSAEQRAWLENFLKVISVGTVAPDTAAPAAAAEGAAEGAAAQTAVAAPEEEAVSPDMPWHDPSLGMEERMQLAEGKPLPLRLMAAMAQLDCHACGYDCQGYSAAIADGSEKNLSLCVPGQKQTEEKLKEIMKAEGKL